MTNTDAPFIPWPGVELRHLLALSALAREGSFRAAAESLGYVQSAVSVQVAQLEELVGLTLVHRQSGTASDTLTEAGTLLLRHVEKVLDGVDAAEAALTRLREGSSTTLRVGVHECVAGKVLPRIIVALAQSFPGLKFQLEDTLEPEHVSARVAAGELDLAFGDLPLPDGAFETRELVRDPYVLLVPSDRPIAKATDPPTPAQLARIPLVQAGTDAVAEEADARIRMLCEEPRYVFRAANHMSVQQLVAAGVGAAIVSQLSVDRGHPRTVALPLPRTLIQPRPIAIYWRADRPLPPAAKAFADLAERVCVEESTGHRAYMLAAA